MRSMLRLVLRASAHHGHQAHSEHTIKTQIQSIRAARLTDAINSSSHLSDFIPQPTL